MSLQPVAFYYYHGIREGVDAGGSFEAASAAENSTEHTLYDGRQGHAYVWSTTLGTSTSFVRPPLAQDALSDAIDHLIISGHNFTGANLNIVGRPSTDDYIDPNHPVVAADRTVIVVPFSDLPINPSDANIEFRVFQGSAADIAPEVTELFFTTKHTMAKRPRDGWDHGWRRSDRQFENQQGVTSTWLYGASRKSYRFTWDHLTGADLTILENMRTQTDDFTQPFFVQVPDDAFDSPLLMEIDRDSDWQQSFIAPLQAGVAHVITLPLVEVMG